MSEPEINFYLDEFGSIKCSVTNKGVLLGEDEQKFIVDSFTQLRDENAKLRRLVADMWFWRYEGHIDSESQERQMSHIDAVIQRMRELGIEV